MSFDVILDRVERYYTETLRLHGPAPDGVDWNSAESQQLRFHELLRLFDLRDGLSVNDYGCGYAALVDYLDSQGLHLRYCGYDIAEEMIRCAVQRHAGRTDCLFTDDESRLSPASYSVASGIFNVKLGTPDDEWLQYVYATLDRIASLSTQGFAFNLLTTYGDADRRQERLFYADPLRMFDYCRTRFSRRVALLHDYPLYEFTIVVRVGGE